jgi:hypothetical protein
MEMPQLGQRVLPDTTRALLKGLIVFGTFVFVVGLGRDPTRIWPSFLVATFYLLTLGLAGTFFIALNNVCGGRWHTCFRRVPEAMSTVIPWAGLLLVILVFFGGMSTLYEWTHHDAVGHDPLLAKKSAWLNTPFFLIRMLFYFGIWTALSVALIRNSRNQDIDGNPKSMDKNKKLSAAFIVLFAITFSGASFDLVMSLEAHWYSTIFAVYMFSGLFLNGLATITLLLIILRRMGPLAKIVSKEHLQDMGTLMFAFSCFWAYIWFSQYMLIWYSNIPEETGYYMNRHTAMWGSLSLSNFLINWTVPFFCLMNRNMKRNEKVLLVVSVLLMIGHWLDLFIMVQPVFFASNPEFGLLDIGPIVGVIALFFLLFFENAAKANIIPINDIYLEQSLHHHH